MRSFIFFGCWNRDYCNVDVAPRDLVISLIRKNLNILKPDKLIVGGDNIYQLETPRGKINRKITIDNGFHGLSLLKIPVDILLGNHDEDGKGCVLDYQISKAGKNLHIFPENHIENNSSINTIYLNTNRSNTLEGTIEIANYIIENMDTQKLNIIVGHHPIFCFEGKKKNSYYYLHEFLDIVIPFSKQNNIKWLYLCADTHNFQMTILEYRGYSVPQIISGTGGALLHNIPKLGTYIDNNVQLHTIFTKENYGFCYILADGLEASIIFISATEGCNAHHFRIKNQHIYNTNLPTIHIDCHIESIIPDYRKVMASDCHRVENYNDKPDSGDFIGANGKPCYKWKMEKNNLF